jgi:hypothetical protein
MNPHELLALIVLGAVGGIALPILAFRGLVENAPPAAPPRTSAAEPDTKG